MAIRSSNCCSSRSTNDGKLTPVDLATEQALRQQIFDALARIVAEIGVVTREQLSSFPSAQRPGGSSTSPAASGTPRHVRHLGRRVVTGRPVRRRRARRRPVRYDYRAGSTGGGDNTKLRAAYELALPIILLRKIDNGVYVPIFPVFVIGDDLAARQFVLAVDESLRFLTGVGQHSIAERRYAERIARYRLHQAEFRGRVLRAYQTQCAVCSLRHGRLLDAAHIIGDRAEGGEPVVPNGLSMCKIHHAAFDGNLLGISPDCTIHINNDLLHETDGPMLRHGLQEMHGRVLVLPARRVERPDRDRLAARWAEFEKAG